MEDEDKHALQGVENGEEVGHDNGALIDVHQSKSPGKTQKTQQGYSPYHPRPNRREKLFTHNQCIDCKWGSLALLFKPVWHGTRQG